MKYSTYIFLVLIAFFQVSCFEVIEEVKIHQDGSGTFKYTVNFSQSAAKIKSLLLMDEVEGYKVPTEHKMVSEFHDICNLTKSIEGISNVTRLTDFENYIFIYGCDFKKVENLNTIIDSLSKKTESVDYLKTDYFSYSKETKIFRRVGDDIFKEAYDKLSESKKAIFTGAQYTSVYRFESEVDRVSEENAIVSVNKKAVLHKLELVLLAKKGSAINKQIYLK